MNNHRLQTLLLVTVLLVSQVPWEPASAAPRAIHRCLAPPLPPTFSDLPCPAGQETEPYRVEASPGLKPAPLSNEEL